jgi:hypothetical protein
MFLRIARSHAQPGSLSQSQIDSLNKDILAALKRAPGFQHSYQATDMDGGHAVVISVWDTKEHAQLDRSSLGDVIGRIRQAGIEIDPPEIYEINAQS